MVGRTVGQACATGRLPVPAACEHGPMDPLSVTCWPFTAVADPRVNALAPSPKACSPPAGSAQPLLLTPECGLCGYPQRWSRGLHGQRLGGAGRVRAPGRGESQGARHPPGGRRRRPARRWHQQPGPGLRRRHPISATTSSVPDPDRPLRFRPRDCRCGGGGAWVAPGPGHLLRSAISRRVDGPGHHRRRCLPGHRPHGRSLTSTRVPSAG